MKEKTTNKPFFQKLPSENNSNQLDEVFHVSERGCLGLLALGDIGLIAWRKKRIAFLKENNPT